MHSFLLTAATVAVMKSSEYEDCTDSRINYMGRERILALDSG